MKQFLKRRILIGICLSCASIAIFFGSIQTVDSSSVLAQSTLNNSDIISLRARLSRLEQEVNQLKSYSLRPSNSSPAKKLPISPTTSPSSRPTVVNPPVVDGRAIGKSDPMYERLATLLIELKEDIRNIDERLTTIEQKTAP